MRHIFIYELNYSSQKHILGSEKNKKLGADLLGPLLTVVTKFATNQLEEGTLILGHHVERDVASSGREVMVADQKVSLCIASGSQKQER